MKLEEDQLIDERMYLFHMFASQLSAVHAALRAAFWPSGWKERVSSGHLRCNRAGWASRRGRRALGAWLLTYGNHVDREVSRAGSLGTAHVAVAEVGIDSPWPSRPCKVLLLPRATGPSSPDAPCLYPQYVEEGIPRRLPGFVTWCKWSISSTFEHLEMAVTL